MNIEAYFIHCVIVIKMDLLCQGLQSCAPCCSNECKWLTFENKSESCHPSIENLEDVIKMVDKVENCTAIPANTQDELIKGE